MAGEIASFRLDGHILDILPVIAVDRCCQYADFRAGCKMVVAAFKLPQLQLGEPPHIDLQQRIDAHPEE